MIASILSSDHNTQNVLVVQGERDHRRATETRHYDQVHDVLAGYDPSADDENYPENLESIKALEQDVPSFRYRESVSIDRYLRRRGWSEERIAGYATHIIEEFQKVVAPIRDDLRIAFGEANALAYRVFQALVPEEVPYVVHASARHWQDRMFWTRGQTWSWKSCRELYRRYRKEGIPGDVRNKAVDKLRDIREKYESPRYANYDDRPSGFVHHLRNAIRRSLEDARNELHFGESQKNPRRRPLKNVFPDLPGYVSRTRNLRYWNRISVQNVPRDKTLASMFLHIEPEYVIDGPAFEFRDQMDTAKHIAAALPAEMVLCVKEHPKTLGERPKEEIERLEQDPNIHLLSHEIPSYHLIDASELVFTLAGTPALEAMYVGTPSVIFSDVFFEAFQGVHKAPSVARLPQTIETALEDENAPTEDSALCALAAMHDVSHPVTFDVGDPLCTLEDIREDGNLQRLRRSLASVVQEKHRPDTVMKAG